MMPIIITLAVFFYATAASFIGERQDRGFRIFTVLLANLPLVLCYIIPVEYPWMLAVAIYTAVSCIVLTSILLHNAFQHWSDKKAFRNELFTWTLPIPLLVFLPSILVFIHWIVS